MCDYKILALKIIYRKLDKILGVFYTICLENSTTAEYGFVGENLRNKKLNEPESSFSMKLCQLPSKVIDPVDLNTRPSAGTVYQPKQRDATVYVR